MSSTLVTGTINVRRGATDFIGLAGFYSGGFKFEIIHHHVPSVLLEEIEPSDLVKYLCLYSF
jgi:hypothetical protein